MKKNYRYYIAPYSKLTLNIDKNIFGCSENFLGYVDKNQKGKGIYTLQSLKEFDYIIIYSPNHDKDIFKTFISHKVPKHKILFYIDFLQKPISNYYLATIYSKILTWKYYSLANTYKIKQFRNIHSEKRAFIVGNGPSLKTEDLEKLKNEITFAANKIYLCYEQTNWRPHYYFVEDDLVFKQNYENIKNIGDSKKFFPSYSIDWERKIKNSIYFNLIYEPHSKLFPQFNPMVKFYWGSTVVYTMIQWAIYMGIKEIYLIGLDFSFTLPNKKEFNLEKNQMDLISEGEVNHFHKDYRKNGEKWNLPNLEKQLISFQKAKEYCDTHSIKIYNASRQTKLEVFERKNFDEIFKDKQC